MSFFGHISYVCFKAKSIYNDKIGTVDLGNI